MPGAPVRYTGSHRFVGEPFDRARGSLYPCFAVAICRDYGTQLISTRDRDLSIRRSDYHPEDSVICSGLLPPFAGVDKAEVGTKSVVRVFQTRPLGPSRMPADEPDIRTSTETTAVARSASRGLTVDRERSPSDKRCRVELVHRSPTRIGGGSRGAHGGRGADHRLCSEAPTRRRFPSGSNKRPSAPQGCSKISTSNSAAMRSMSATRK